MESELVLIHKKMAKLENTSILTPQINNLDVYSEFRDRRSTVKKLFFFNVPDSKHEDLSIQISIDTDILVGLSLGTIKINCAKRLGNLV